MRSYLDDGGKAGGSLFYFVYPLHQRYANIISQLSGYSVFDSDHPPLPFMSRRGAALSLLALLHLQSMQDNLQQELPNQPNLAQGHIGEELASEALGSKVTAPLQQS